jgi:hypothetical protein
MFVAVAALATVMPSRTDACMNAVLATDKVIAGVKEAEKILDEGNPAEARLRIRGLLRGADAFDEKTPSAKGVNSRVRRILALATLRLDPDNDRTPDERRGLLEGAVVWLEGLVKESPNDAAKQSDLGEGLAKTKPSEAAKLLEDLAQRDVVATPYAYAALARVRAARGDAKGRDEALARCRPMAKVASICQLEPAPASK